ncbi:hypothetical protein ACA040_002235 [Xenophilus aerolatus]
MKWEDLASKEVVGALIGAAGAFWAALWVARDARKREERSAAMVVIGTLGTLLATAHTIFEIAPEGADDKALAKHVAGKLMTFFPRLDPLYGACVARLLPLHPVMAARLQSVSLYYDTMAVVVERLRVDEQVANQKGKPDRSNEDLIADAQIALNGLRAVLEHGAVAQEMINRLVLYAYPALQSLGMRLGLVGSPALKEALKSAHVVVKSAAVPK